MKASIEELLGVVYRYYPRGIPYEDPRYKATEENRQLVEARRKAGAAIASWNALWLRLTDRFPECDVMSHSLHLPTGQFDACYSGAVSRRSPPEGEHSHGVGYLVSFLVPYYVVYSTRIVDAGVEERAGDGAPIWFDADTVIVGARFRGTSRAAGLTPEKRESTRARRHDISLVPNADDQGYWDVVIQEIEETFKCEPMPPEVGRIVVPDVATNHRRIGQATLYDCLLNDSWP
jgi:hypothetical protein